MSAPLFRSLDQHTGTVAPRPSKFFEANDRADDIAAELEFLRAHRADVDELELELAWMRERSLALVKFNAQLQQRIARLESEADILRLLAAVRPA